MRGRCWWPWCCCRGGMTPAQAVAVAEVIEALNVVASPSSGGGARG